MYISINSYMYTPLNRQMANDIKESFKYFSPGTFVVVGDARPGAQEKYEQSSAGEP
jgi:hypothetical protein